MELGTLLPSIEVPPPGPASRALAGRLRRVESRNVTFLSEDFPVFWEAAAGANVRDADGNVYVDVTSAFGVALAGHAHPRIVAAVERQARSLMHGMGDVHPPSVRVELLERLAGLAPWSDARCVLASTGSEAVEIALKTALLATGRPGILAFEGGYHGLTAGALAATARPYFREPFAERLYGGVVRVPFPDPRDGDEGRAGVLERVEEALRGTPATAPDRPSGADRGPTPIGAILVEPVQGRGGVRLPPPGFMAELGRLARAHGALVIADEVFTGMGRCGGVLASHRVGLEPDVVCLGKALGGGMPVSACLAPAGVMDAWPTSPGEALHTSTFLGHPPACAAALAVLDLLDEGLAERADRLGVGLLDRLGEALDGVAAVSELRGLGAMIGIELAGPGGRDATGGAADVATRLLRNGVIALPAGDEGRVLELTPPTCLTGEQAELVVERLAQTIVAWAS